MQNRLAVFLRLLAATLVTASGAGRITSLWFRDLDEAAVSALIAGSIYLIIGIGLFGQSRFALFVAIAMCATTAFFLLQRHELSQLQPAQQLAILADGLTVACCSAVLVLRRLRGIS